MEIAKKLHPAIILIVVAVATLFCSGRVSAVDITCDGDIYTALQNAIIAATDDDIINILPGSCSLSSAVTWTDKNIKIIGAGIGATTVTASNGTAFSVTNNTTAKSAFRISAITIDGTPNASSGFIKISSRDQTTAAAVYGWKVDNVKYVIGDNSSPAMTIWGTNWGLIDACVFERTKNTDGDAFFTVLVGSVLASDLGPPILGGKFSSERALDLGTANAVYFQNSTFEEKGTNQSGSAPIDADFGARYVFRGNNVTNGGILNHPTKGTGLGGSKYEIYCNTFVNTGIDLAYAFFSQGGGTGVIFSNTLTGFAAGGRFGLDDRRDEDATGLGYCDGEKIWDGNVEGGYPCYFQVGRSGVTGLISSPVYAWNNGPEATCATGGVCTDTYLLYSANSEFVKSTAHSNGDVDFVNAGSTPKAGYAALGTHPLADITAPNQRLGTGPAHKLGTGAGVKLQ